MYYSQHYQALPEISVREIAEPRRAHNLYLEMAAEVGLIGLLVFMAIPLLLLRDLRLLRLELQRRAPPLARLSAAFTLMLLAYLGTGMFLHLAFERYYWLMIGLTAGGVGALAAAAEEIELRRAGVASWARQVTWASYARDAGAMSSC
jgi:O-antigen ligase